MLSSFQGKDSTKWLKKNKKQTYKQTKRKPLPKCTLHLLCFSLFSVERIKAEAAEAANRALAEMQKKHELLMAQKDQSYQEHMKQLTEKMEQERKELMAEQQRIISLKLQVPGCTMCWLHWVLWLARFCLLVCLFSLVIYFIFTIHHNCNPSLLSSQFCPYNSLSSLHLSLLLLGYHPL